MNPKFSNRLTTSWKITGTVFFRLASSALFKHPGYHDGFGTNMQNPAESLMRCVQADEGKIFVSADQEGAEARIVAMEAPPGNFRALFDAGIKPHQYMAVDLFVDDFRQEFFPTQYSSYFANVSPPLVSTLPEWRAMVKSLKGAHAPRYFLGKKTIHAKNYAMGWRTFQTSALEESEGKLVLSPEQAKFFLARHEFRFPEILEWQAYLRDLVLRTRVVRNLFGYPIHFTRALRPTAFREVYAAIPQSTVGTITNLAFAELQHVTETQRLPYDLLNNKHDSILLQVPNTKEHVLQAKCLLQKHLGRELTSSRGETYRMGTEVSIGHFWGKHSSDFPHGMRDWQKEWD